MIQSFKCKETEKIFSRKYSKKLPTDIQRAAYFGNSASFWLGLQMDYDLDVAEDALSSRIQKEVHQLVA